MLRTSGREKVFIYIIIIADVEICKVAPNIVGPSVYPAHLLGPVLHSMPTDRLNLFVRRAMQPLECLLEVTLFRSTP